jgi:PAS domain S-box-containing protein
VRLRLIAPVSFMIAAIAGAFVLTRLDSAADAWLVLATGLALAAVTVALALTTQRRRRATREVERYFTLTPEMVIFAGFDGYWKRVNPAVEAVLGYSEREALARPFMEFVHPDDRERTEQEASRVVGGATALSFENRIVCKDGSYNWIEWSVVPVPEEGVMYGVGRDITERRRSESEQTALRRLAMLVAQEVPPSEVFSAIVEEIGRLLGTEEIRMLRFDTDRSAVVVGGSGGSDAFPLGSRHQLEGDTVASRVLRTGRTTRIDNYREVGGPLAEATRSIGVRAVVGAPILVAGRLWGAITTGSTSDEPLPPDTESRLLHFTELMATAIANAEAREALQRLADEQAALRRVAVLVAQQPSSSSEVFTAVTEAVGLLLEADLAVLHHFAGDGTATTIASWSGDGPLLPIGTRFPLDGENLAARIFESGAPARIFPHEEAWQREATDLVRSLHMRSAVGAPILVEGKLWGALMAASRGVEPWAENAETRIAAFTELVATAIANAESRGALAEVAEEQAALRRVATLVARDAPSAEVFDAVATEVGKLLGTDITVVGRYDGDGAATAIGSWSASGGGLPVGTRSVLGGHNVLTIVAETGQPARVDGYAEATGEASDIARRYGWRSSIAAPIAVEGRVWGVMLVATERPEPFPAGSEKRLAEFTDLVATAVGNAQARAEVERLADEQAALRRVATLVARGTEPVTVFRVVCDEAQALLGADLAGILRFHDDRTVTVMANSGGPGQHSVGVRVSFDPGFVVDWVHKTHQAARFDTADPAAADMPEVVRMLGVRSAVGSPIVVEGELWGAITLASVDRSLPFGMERRLADFTELVATAIANAESGEALARLAEVQAALRRVATLVARRLGPEPVFSAVADEVSVLFGPSVSAIVRFEDDDKVTVLADRGGWNPPGSRVDLDPDYVVSSVRKTHRAARFDTDDPAAAGMPELVRSLGIRSAIAAPVIVEGEPWGATTIVAFDRPFPPDTERRLVEFTELVATAVANAQSRSELAASRRRIVAASDETRRRIERDLHDGTQQRLVSLGLAVRAAEASLPPERDDLRAQLSGIATGLVAAVEDLQEISRGIHPAILSKGGLAPALQTLAHRSAIPVDLDITTDVRLAEPIEVAAYFVASEALANAAKHSQASRIDVSLGESDGSLLLSVGDDGVGGADAGRGSGLVGLTDRVEALGGSIRVFSRLGEGTQITAELPLELELPQPVG